MIGYLNAVDTLVVVVVVHGVVGRKEDPFIVGHGGAALGWGEAYRDTGVVKVVYLCSPNFICFAVDYADFKLLHILN